MMNLCAQQTCKAPILTFLGLPSEGGPVLGSINGQCAKQLRICPLGVSIPVTDRGRAVELSTASAFVEVLTYRPLSPGGSLEEVI